uniref:Uncharacterized protein n=1 Tax=Denticeps clupeoides TaxID=299321 RepID=A0AAY4BU99_9TELE
MTGFRIEIPGHDFCPSLTLSLPAPCVKTWIYAPLPSCCPRSVTSTAVLKSLVCSIEISVHSHQALRDIDNVSCDRLILAQQRLVATSLFPTWKTHKRFLCPRCLLEPMNSDLWSTLCITV